MEQHSVKTAEPNVQTQETDKYKQAATAIGGYVDRRPWRAVGIAAATGALVGFSTAKR